MKILRVEPSPYGLLKTSGPLTVKVTFSYTLDAVGQLNISNTSIVYSKTDDADTIKGLLAAAEASSVATTLLKGTGEVTIEVPVNLTGAVAGQRVHLDGTFSTTTTSGVVQHPVSQLVQYTIGS